MLEPLPAQVLFISKADASIDIEHIFCTAVSELSRSLATFRKTRAPRRSGDRNSSHESGTQDRDRRSAKRVHCRPAKRMVSRLSLAHVGLHSIRCAKVARRGWRAAVRRHAHRSTTAMERNTLRPQSAGCCLTTLYCRH
jgi:hypothetical protein